MERLASCLLPNPGIDLLVDEDESMAKQILFVESVESCFGEARGRKVHLGTSVFDKHAAMTANAQTAE